MPVYININTVSEFVCLFVSLICLYKDKDPVWRALIFFLLVTCAVEVAGIHLRKELHRPNFMLYNIFLIVECFIQSYFFYHLIKVYKDKAMVLVIWIVLFLLCYFTELYKNHLGGFVFQTSSLMSVMLVLAGVYFNYLVLKDERFKRLSTDASFWWVSGTLCFYFGSTACNIFFEYLVHDKTPAISHSVRYIVFNILNIVLYLNWSYAFICRYRQRISSSSSD